MNCWILFLEVSHMELRSRVPIPLENEMERSWFGMIAGHPSLEDVIKLFNLIAMPLDIVK